MRNKLLHKDFNEISKNETLPINYSFTQLYSQDDEMEDKSTIPNEFKVEVKAYQIPFINLYPSFHKPISKLLKY